MPGPSPTVYAIRLEALVRWHKPSKTAPPGKRCIERKGEREGSIRSPFPVPRSSICRRRLRTKGRRGGFSWKTTATDLVPNTDVIESDKEIEITAELPGLQEKDVQVNVADNVLTSKGEKKAEKGEG
jgi:HSP20 family molecular chaperone IbpA